MTISFDNKRQEIDKEIQPYLERKQELLDDLKYLGSNNSVVELMTSHEHAGLGTRFWINTAGKDEVGPTILVIGNNDGKGIQLVFQENGEGQIEAGEWLDSFQRSIKLQEELTGNDALDRVQELVQKGLEEVAEEILEAAKQLSS